MKFTKINNERALRSDEFRVWAHGLSTIVRSPEGAIRAYRLASPWCARPSIVDRDGMSYTVRCSVDEDSLWMWELHEVTT